MKILIINGPNLNMLGEREPHIYGTKTLVDIEKETSKKLNNKSLSLEWYQSNLEGEIVSKIQEAFKNGTELTPVAMRTHLLPFMMH
jgi:3-dehydroquinate dehydratase-2